MIKATDIDSKLADKQWSNTGLIAPDAPAIRSVNLTVPDRYNYVGRPDLEQFHDRRAGTGLCAAQRHDYAE